MRRRGKEIGGLQPTLAIRYICESEQAFIEKYLVISVIEISIGRQTGIETYCTRGRETVEIGKAVCTGK